jgi:hypothetical protein
MKTDILEIVKDKAVQAFKNADQKGKQLLTDLFGKKVLTVDVIERIETWEDVFADHETTESEALPWKNANTPAKVWLNAVEMIRLLFESLNEGEVLDFTKADQRKVRGWVNIVKDDNDPAGFRVTGTSTYWTNTGTNVGSRLCLKDERLWQHVFANTHFMEKFKIYFNK